MAKWVPGQSGNPLGKAPGAARIQPFRDAIRKRVPEIIDALITSALAGDSTASKLLLERVLPPLKAVDTPVILSGLTSQPGERAEGILRALADGIMTPDESVTVMNALRQAAELTAIADIVARLDKLESDHEPPRA